ncbi:MAG TPA: ABC transporter ATP-binding protein [Arachnia sp.]|nr:ABC transporter ATP-binding protein [Arachnia sp.]
MSPTLAGEHPIAVHPDQVSTTTARAIALTGVTKDFGEVQAVRGLDLTVRKGEVVAFLGPNGAGKTTTIDMVLGLSQPTTGSVEVFGLTPEEAIARGLVSAVMQSGGLLKDLTVRDTVRFIAATFPGARPVEEVMATAGITELAGRQVGKCSGGEQQRLRFALALVSDPELIILDEPTVGMDVATRRAFWEAIRLDARAGRTIIFATHYLEEADLYADRIVLVREGSVVADGTSSQIKASVTGRTLRATWPDADEAMLTAYPGVTGVEIHGDGITIHTTDSDTLARYLLATTGAHDLEIVARGLEDAFVALTATSKES